MFISPVIGDLLFDGYGYLNDVSVLKTPVLNNNTGVFNVDF